MELLLLAGAPKPDGTRRRLIGILSALPQRELAPKQAKLRTLKSIYAANVFTDRVRKEARSVVYVFWVP